LKKAEAACVYKAKYWIVEPAVLERPRKVTKVMTNLQEQPELLAGV